MNAAERDGRQASAVMQIWTALLCVITQLDGLEIESRWEARFSAPVQTGPGGPPSLLYNGYRFFPWG